MSAAPPWRRGIASGTRTMLQNTGAVISIALMLLIVTSVVPTEPALPHLQRPHHRPLGRPASSPSCTGCTLALWVLVAFSLLGAAVSAPAGKARRRGRAEPSAA